MIDFSELTKNQTISERDNIIKNVASRSGIDEPRISKMYDVFDFQLQGDTKKIFESFQLMLDKPKFDDKIFKNLLLDIQKDVDSSVIDVDARAKATQKMIGVVENFAKRNDTPKLIELVSFILNEKNSKFSKVSEKIDFGKDIKKLFESEKMINFSPINISKDKTGDENKLLAETDKKLYESLKDILGRNNRRWGHNYHLDNAYTAILEYLDEEIKELANENSIYSIDDTFHNKLIFELFNSNNFNQMYCSLNYLRDLVPDLQTLCFDMMIFANEYINQNKAIMEYFDVRLTDNYYKSMFAFYTQISSSRRLSKLISNKSQENEPSYVSDKSLFDYGKLSIDFEKYDTFRNKIKPDMALNAVKIIFACQTDFPMKTRKIINNYVTCATNLIISSNKKIIQARKPMFY